MTATVSYTDSEQAVRLWLRTTTVGALARIDFGAGTDYTPSRDGALVVVEQAGGQPDAYSSTDLPVLSFSCWGATKKQAADVKTALLAALHNVRRHTTTAGLVVDATVLSVLWRPDPDDSTPRYVVDALLAVQPTEET